MVPHLETAGPCGDQSGAVAPCEARHLPCQQLPRDFLAGPPVPHHQCGRLALSDAGQVFACESREQTCAMSSERGAAVDPETDMKQADYIYYALLQILACTVCF